MNFAKRRRLVLFGLSAMVCFQPATSPAVITRDDQPDSAYVALGALADFVPVGLFSSGGGYTGCGILIAPDWVLTAAHLLIASSGTFTINGTSYDSTQVFRNSGWNGDVLHGNDFGLVHLASSLTAIPPAMFYTGSVETNQVGTFVGYGFTGTGLTGWKTIDGQKRAFKNVIDGNFGNPYLLLGADFDNPNNPGDNWFGSATPLTLEGCVAPGDSGGGVFIQQGPQYYLAGVISGILATDGNANGDYGDITAYGRLSAALPWINSIINVPEPSVGSLLIGTGLVALCFRLRKQ